LVCGSPLIAEAKIEVLQKLVRLFQNERCPPLAEVHSKIDPALGSHLRASSAGFHRAPDLSVHAGVLSKAGSRVVYLISYEYSDTWLSRFGRESEASAGRPQSTWSTNTKVKVADPRYSLRPKNISCPQVFAKQCRRENEFGMRYSQRQRSCFTNSNLMLPAHG